MSRGTLLQRCMIRPEHSTTSDKPSGTERKKCIQWDEENIRQTELERPIRQQGVARASDEPKTPYVKWVESEGDEPTPMQLSEESFEIGASGNSCTSTTGGSGGGGTTDEEEFIQKRKEHYKLPSVKLENEFENI
jgi:hypothetical protein